MTTLGLPDLTVPTLANNDLTLARTVDDGGRRDRGGGGGGGGGSLALNDNGRHFGDNFNRDDGAIGSDYDYSPGSQSGMTISSNQARFAHSSGGRYMYIKLPNVEAGYLQVSGTVTAVDAYIYLWFMSDKGSNAYALRFGDFGANDPGLIDWNGGFPTAIDVTNGDPSPTAGQTFQASIAFADSLQLGCYSVAGGAVAQYAYEGADTGEDAATGRFVGIGTQRRGGSPDTLWDNLLFAAGHLVSVDGLPTGFKARVKDGGGTVVSTATESGGTAEIPIHESKQTGTKTWCPFAGFPTVEVLNAADAVQATYTGSDASTNVHPGASLTYTA